VLVVDDEADTRELLTTALEQYGASSSSSIDGRALAALEQFRPDVLVEDIGMPDKDGYALLRQVRAMDTEHGGILPAIVDGACEGVRPPTSSEAGFQTCIQASLASYIACRSPTTGEEPNLSAQPTPNRR